MTTEAATAGMAPRAKKAFWSSINPWSIGTLLIAAAVAVPIVVVVFVILRFQFEVIL